MEGGLTEDLVGHREPCQLDGIPAQGTLSTAAPIFDRKGSAQVSKGTRLRWVEGFDSITVIDTRRVRNPEVAGRCYFGYSSGKRTVRLTTIQCP